MLGVQIPLAGVFFLGSRVYANYKRKLGIVNNMVSIKKVYLGEIESFYKIFSEYENGICMETFFPKDIDKLESYVCGLYDGAYNGSAALEDVILENGFSEKKLNPMPNKDFKRVIDYVRSWHSFQLAVCTIND